MDIDSIISRAEKVPIWKEIILFGFYSLVTKLQALHTKIYDGYATDGSADSNKLPRYGDPYVELYLNPNCQHRVKIKASLGEMWAQMVIINHSKNKCDNIIDEFKKNSAEM